MTERARHTMQYPDTATILLWDLIYHAPTLGPDFPSVQWGVDQMILTFPPSFQLALKIAEMSEYPTGSGKKAQKKELYLNVTHARMWSSRTGVQSSNHPFDHASTSLSTQAADIIITVTGNPIQQMILTVYRKNLHEWRRLYGRRKEVSILARTLGL